MSERVHSYLFAGASLLPAVLIVLAAVDGIAWGGLALVSLTLWVFAMDRFGPHFEASRSLTKPLPIAVAFGHFAALGATVWAVGQNDDLTTGTKLLLVVAMGLFAGQISNASAHELIHRSSKRARGLGTAIYCSILNGHHVSAHLLVHHVHAGTERDPNSAPLGKGFYRYALEASVAEYRAGRTAENKRRTDRPSLQHPYVVYTGGALASLVTAWILGSLWGALALVAISAHAQTQLLLSDYVQHYGLRRKTDAAGKPEPMRPQHSWNAPQSYSAAMMVNAPRHSDHHMNPARVFTDLRLTPEMPTLPRSMPVMATIALIPPLWREIMDHRVAEWTGQSQPVDTVPLTASQAIASSE